MRPPLCMKSAALFEEAPFLAIVNGVHFDWNDPEASLAPQVARMIS
jgi:hypothetical protein